MKRTRASPDFEGLPEEQVDESVRTNPYDRKAKDTGADCHATTGT